MITLESYQGLIRSRIHKLIEARYGIQSHILISELSAEFLGYQIDEIKNILLDMILDKEIIEIEYIIDGKSRSFFLPANSEIRILK